MADDEKNVVVAGAASAGSTSCRSATSAKLTSDELVEKLKRHFNHSQFKSKLQQKAVQKVLDRTDDVFISMPTGSGKSLCFQLPGVVQDNQLTIVFSPLLALIKDQIDHLAKLRICAESINSKMTQKERDRVQADLRSLRPNTRFLYITPEQAVTESFRGQLGTLMRFDRVAYFAVDEAHCVSEWGHDFRPDYLRLGELRVLYPSVPWIALTATASKQVVADIEKRLRLKRPVAMFKTPCFRQNLFYDVVFKEAIPDDFTHLKAYVLKCLGHVALDAKDNKKPCGIIYCRTRENVERIAHGLSKHGVPTKAYHGGLRTAERIQVQEDWMDGVYPVICATISFGMGVDKSSVRFVIHWDIAQSVAGYYQESGRAGRDGQRSYCRIYYCRKDVNTIDYILKKDISLAKEHRKEQAMRSYKDFQQMCTYCVTLQCRHRLFSNYFGDAPPKCDRMCDVCDDRKRAEHSLDAFNKLSMNFYTGGRISAQDGSYLYGGGRDGMKEESGLVGGGMDGSDQEHGMVSALARAKQETSSLIQRQFAQRKVAAAKEAEMHPTAQLTKVRAAMSTAVKVSGLSNTIRESYLKMMADLLKANYVSCKANHPTEHELVYRDFEDVAIGIEYECFSRNKVLALYRRSCAIEGNKIKKITIDGQMNELLKTHKPRKRNLVGGDSKDIQRKYDKLVEKTETKDGGGIRRKSGFKKDPLTQTKVSVFFEKSKEKPSSKNTDKASVSVSPLEAIVSEEVNSRRISFEDIESDDDPIRNTEVALEQSASNNNIKSTKVHPPLILLSAESKRLVDAQLAAAERSDQMSTAEHHELIRQEIQAYQRDIERLDEKIRKTESTSSRRHKERRQKHKRDRSTDHEHKSKSSKHRSRSPKRIKTEREPSPNDRQPIFRQRSIDRCEVDHDRSTNAPSMNSDQEMMADKSTDQMCQNVRIKQEPKSLCLAAIKREATRSVSPALTVFKMEPPDIKQECPSPASSIFNHDRIRRSLSREHDFDGEFDDVRLPTGHTSDDTNIVAGLNVHIKEENEFDDVQLSGNGPTSPASTIVSSGLNVRIKEECNRSEISDDTVINDELDFLTDYNGQQTDKHEEKKRWSDESSKCGYKRSSPSRSERRDGHRRSSSRSLMRRCERSNSPSTNRDRTKTERSSRRHGSSSVDRKPDVSSANNKLKPRSSERNNKRRRRRTTSSEDETERRQHRPNHGSSKRSSSPEDHKHRPSKSTSHPHRSRKMTKIPEAIHIDGSPSVVRPRNPIASTSIDYVSADIKPETTSNPTTQPKQLNIEDPVEFDGIAEHAKVRIIEAKKQMLAQVERKIQLLTRDQLTDIDHRIRLETEHVKRQRDDELEQILGTNNLDDWDSDEALSNVPVARQYRQRCQELLLAVNGRRSSGSAVSSTITRHSLTDQLALVDIDSLMSSEPDRAIQTMLAAETDYANMSLNGRIIELENRYAGRRTPNVLADRIKAEKKRISKVVIDSLMPYYNADRIQPQYLFNDVARHISRLFYARKSDSTQIRDHVNRIFVQYPCITSVDDVINSKFL